MSAYERIRRHQYPYRPFSKGKSRSRPAWIYGPLTVITVRTTGETINTTYGNFTSNSMVRLCRVTT
jgi:hypothetical protein